MNQYDIVEAFSELPTWKTSADTLLVLFEMLPDGYQQEVAAKLKSEYPNLFID